MSSDVAGLTWLQRQQQKLRERKDSMRRAERHPHEARLLNELRSSQQFKGQQQQQQQQLQQQQQPVSSSHRPVDDAGYLSDVTMFSELDMVNTSREGSPDIRSAYATPLHINTAGTYGQYQQVLSLLHLFCFSCLFFIASNPKKRRAPCLRMALFNPRLMERFWAWKRLGQVFFYCVSVIAYWRDRAVA